MEVRPAEPAELATVMSVLDGAVLDVGVDAVRAAIDAGAVLVAAEGGRVLGALVVEPGASPARVEAVAVRRRRRGQGLGTALVRAAAARHDRLVAAFDPGVRPFWASLGFDVEPAEDGDRFVGTLGGDEAR